MNKVVLSYVSVTVGFLSKTLIYVFPFTKNNKQIFKLTPANKLLIYFNSSIYKARRNIASSVEEL